MTNSGDDGSRRLWLAGLGALAAVALRYIGQAWDDPTVPPGLALALFAFVLTHAIVAMTLTGPLPALRALTGALWLSLPLTALICWAGHRFDAATDLADDPATIGVAVLLVSIVTPFLLVRLSAPGHWRDPARLFDAAWTMHVRFLAAWLFVGTVWVALFLSDTLLSLVDVTLIRALMRHESFAFGLSGAALGLGLAVTWELRATVSPFLALRLLRLLIPLALVVVVGFLLALPFRGFSGLFSEFSAATTLMGVALVGLTLIACALDRDDADAVTSPLLRWSTRGLAASLLLIAALAFWSVSLRVSQHGWTPDRLLAAVSAALLMAYGISYSLAAVQAGWMARIRSANVGLALLVAAVAALWFTPVLNPQRIAAESQVARYLSGKTSLSRLALWELAHDWGRAGNAALERLSAVDDRADHAELMTRIADVRAQTSRFRFDKLLRDRTMPRAEWSERIAARITVVPEGRVDARMFAALDADQLDRISRGCMRNLPDGRPGCAMVRGRFAGAKDEAMILFLAEAGVVWVQHMVISDGVALDLQQVTQVGKSETPFPRLGSKDLAAVLDGNYAIRPTGLNALWIGERGLQTSN